MSKDSVQQEEIVKVYLIDGSHKSAHVNPYRTTIEELWEIIGDKLGLTIEVGVNFFIWGQEDDLELLLYTESTIHEVRAEWSNWYKKYSNTKRDKKKASTFKFLFKPTCIVPLRTERNSKSVEGTNLLYLQCAHNVVNSYYPCDIEMAIKLAGLQASICMGDRNPVIHQIGYLKKAIFEYVPAHLRGAKRPEDWEQLIYTEQELHNGKDVYIKQMLYLQLARQWPYYGSTFFRAKYKPITQGFYRQEFYGEVVVGVNGYGIHVIDPSIMKVISVEFDYITPPEAGPKSFYFFQKFMDKQPKKNFQFLTNQGDLIVDLVYEWFAEYKKQKTEIEQTKLRQQGTLAYSPSGQTLV